MPFTPAYILQRFATETRLDIHGSEYEAVVPASNNKNLGELWNQFRSNFNEGIQYSNSVNRRFGGNRLTINPDWVHQQAEIELFKKEAEI